MTNEKFCLRWNDFETNISVAFRELRDDKDFFDVTLACDDEQIQSHKMILSACSPFFRNILRRNPHKHPLLYLKGVKYSDLQSVLNFMYHGEVNVAQEDLNSFLSVAEDLRVKGLTQSQAEQNNIQRGEKPVGASKMGQSHHPPHQSGSKDNIVPLKRPRPSVSSTPVDRFSSGPNIEEDEVQEVVPVKTEPRDHPPNPPPPSQGTYSSDSHSLAPVEDESYIYQDDQYAEYEQYEGDLVHGGGAVQGDYVAAGGHAGSEIQDPSDLLQFVRRDPLDKRYHCSLCDKFSHTNSYHTRNHVESQHFPNSFTYPCDQCDTVFYTKSNFSMHKSRKHRK